MTDAVARFGLVLDCADPVGLGQFWSAALGYTYVGALGSYAMLASPAGAGPKLLLQKVPEAKQGKNRMHLDIETSDVDAEVERLLALGATRAPVDSEHDEHGMRWVVLADPEGNEFCVCTGAAG